MSDNWSRDVSAGDTGIAIVGAGNVVEIHYLPNLFQLFSRSSLPEHFFILLAARSVGDTQQKRDHFRDEVKNLLGDEFSEQAWQRFAQHIYYFQGDLTKAGDYPRYTNELARLAERHETKGNLIFTLALPTEFFSSVIVLLQQHRLSDETLALTTSNQRVLPPGHRKIVLEKPMGRDLAEIRANEALIQQVFPLGPDKRPRKIRIDHYCFKDPAIAWLMMRSANPYLQVHPGNTARVEVASTKTHGVEGRIAYEGEGRDMFQHLIFDLAMAMAKEPSNGDAAEFWRNVEQFIRHCKPADIFSRCTLRGRYLGGTIRRQTEQGYVESISADSKLSDAEKARRANLETFFGYRFRNELWPNTEFVVYSGKNLPERTSGIWILSSPIQSRFSDNPVQSKISIEFGPRPGIRFGANVKRPGSRLILEPAEMTYDPALLGGHKLDGYGMLWNHLLRDVDYLFPTYGAIEAAAEMLEPVLKYWDSGDAVFDDYPSDTWPSQIGSTLGCCSLVEYSLKRDSI